jgi:hypothetical protein
MKLAKFQWTRMPEKDERCTCCDRILKSECAMLEMDLRTHTYHDGGVFADRSQGWFPFGKACAARVLKNGGAF